MKKASFDLAAMMAEFAAKGGQVKKIDTGVSANQFGSEKKKKKAGVKGLKEPKEYTFEKILEIARFLNDVSVLLMWADNKFFAEYDEYASSEYDYFERMRNAISDKYSRIFDNPEMSISEIEQDICSFYRIKKLAF